MSGLRKEIARGRLEVEIIAGKQFVTLMAIARMRELCRAPKKSTALTFEPEHSEAAAKARRDRFLRRLEADQAKTKSARKRLRGLAE